MPAALPCIANEYNKAQDRIMGTVRQRPVRPGPVRAMRSSAMMIRVTDEQRRAFEREAAMSGLSTSAWARMKLLEVIRNREGKK